MPLRPGTEPYHHDGGRIGVLLLHGYTGSPASLTPWARRLADEGFTVDLPRLPGHGTTWQELNLTHVDDWYAEAERSFLALRDQCDEVFVFALSMGGTLALRLALQYGDGVAGLVLVNPFVNTADPRRHVLPVLARVVPSFPGVVNDIKKGGDEVGYERLPLRALHTLSRSWPALHADLPKVTQPLLLFRSTVDHVIDPSSAALILSRVSSLDVQEVLLHDSYHVATLDNEASTIEDGSIEFVRRLTQGSDTADG